MEREEQGSALDQSMMGTEEALARLYMELLNPTGDKLKTVTDVTPHEIFTLPVLMMMGNKFDSKLARDYSRDFMLLRISRTRASRGEFVFLSSGLGMMNQDKKMKGMGDLFSGLSK